MLDTCSIDYPKGKLIHLKSNESKAEKLIVFSF